MNRRVQSPTISYNAWSVSVFLMLFWSFHSTIWGILHITPAMILGLELFAVGVVMLMTARQAFNNITPMLGWVLFLLITLWNNYYIEHRVWARPAAFFLVISLAYCLQFSNQWYRSLRHCVTIFAWEHFIFSWVFFLSKGFYQSRIIPLFTDEIRIELERYLSQNILMGFTTHFSMSGMFFAFGCIASFIYWLQNKKSVRKILFLLLMIASLIMTQKRGPLVFTACALIVVYFVCEGITIRSFLTFFGGIGVLGAVYFTAAAFYPALGMVFEKFMNTGSNFMTGRDKLYEVAWELFCQSPLFGVGFGQFREYSLNYYSTEYAAHNIYLQLMAELGIIGAIFFVILLLSTLGVTIWTACRTRHNTDREQQFALLFSLGYQVYFITYGMTGNPIYDLQCFIPYFVTIGVPFSVIMQMREGTRRTVEPAEEQV